MFVILVFLIVVILLLWIFVFKSQYVVDLHISISNIIQILVVIVALFNPIWSEYAKREEFGPEPSIKFIKRTPYISKTEMWYVSGSKNVNVYNIYLIITNKGKTILDSAEVVFSGLQIYVPEKNKYVDYELFFPTNFPWFINDTQDTQVYKKTINPFKEEIIKFGTLGIYNDCRFLFPFTKKPTNEQFGLVAGDYRIKLTILGGNITPMSNTLKFIIRNDDYRDLSGAMTSFELDIE